MECIAVFTFLVHSLWMVYFVLYCLLLFCIIWIVVSFDAIFRSLARSLIFNGNVEIINLHCIQSDTQYTHAQFGIVN